MKLPRRKFLHLAAGAAAVPAVSRISWAQTYPTRPVRIIAPTGPGGAPDIGTPGHVAGELFKMMAGVEMIHVPYRGGGAVVSDLLGGQVQVLFGTTSLTAEQVRAGKLRALAVTGATRWEGLPDIPTVGDFVSGYEASSLFGLGAPKQTPAAIIDRLNREINAALDDPTPKTRLTAHGGTLLAGSAT